MARFTFPWSRRERFSSYSVGDPAFAAWIRGGDDGESESVTPYTVLALSAVVRSVNVIAGTIAGLPLKTYEREGDERRRVDSEFDDPYPGIDGMTVFEWVETIALHEALWRKAFLWHEAREDGTPGLAYRPILPDAITKVERVNGRKLFTYRDGSSLEAKVVGSEQITHIPGPSLDGVDGHPMLAAARTIFSGALSGDKAAARTLRQGIRLAGLVVPDEGEEVDPLEGEAILEQLRAKVVGREHAGDIALINRRMKLQPWTPTNVDSQWHEERQFWLGEAGRLFGVPAHLLNDTEKQTSWGAGVAEQTLNFARFTLRHYTDRIQARLSRQLPPGQFVEFDYAGLLEGTPAQEIELLLKQTGNRPMLTTDEARRIRNLPPMTPAQRAELAPAPAPVPQEPPA